MKSTWSKKIESWHLEKFGAVGSIVTLLCCLGFGPLIALFSAVGAGFLINDSVLSPLLLLALGIGGLGLVFSYRRHHRAHGLVLHVMGGALIYGFTFVHYFQPMVWVGVALLLGASTVNFFLKRRCAIQGQACPVH